MSPRGPGVLDANWPAPSGVQAFTTLRSGPGGSTPPFDRFNLGSRCGDDPLTVDANRRALVETYRLPAAPRWLRQVHGTGVVRFEDDRRPQPVEGNATDTEPEADAAVTSAPGVVLAILTADCLPVVFAATDGSEVAAAHAGWRGLAAGVLEATVAAMRTPAAGLVAWLGPAAGPQAYEVGEAVFSAFVAHDPVAAHAFIPTRRDHWHVDLYALARQRLLAAGVHDIHGGGLCTISDPASFYSHRRDQRTGRMATLAWMQA